MSQDAAFGALPAGRPQPSWPTPAFPHVEPAPPHPRRAPPTDAREPPSPTRRRQPQPQPQHAANTRTPTPALRRTSSCAEHVPGRTRHVPGWSGTGTAAGTHRPTFAIVITLLILPLTEDASQLTQADDLPAETWHAWPRFVSFATSFLVIGQFWLAHHRMFGFLRRHNRILLWLNLAVLLTVTFLPFRTALLGAPMAGLTSRWSLLREHDRRELRAGLHLGICGARGLHRRRAG
jgi:Endosomal/lysosomal potassium channel TMEM175